MSFSTACLAVSKACCHSLVKNCVNEWLCCISETQYKVMTVFVGMIQISNKKEKLKFVKDTMAWPVYQFIICILIKGIIKPVIK